MNKIKILMSLITVFVPGIVLAAQPENLRDLINRFTDLISLIIPLIMSLAVLAFLWGLANYIFHGGNETKRKEGQQFIVWGIIVLFVMVSVWGLVGIVSDTIFGDDSNTTPPPSASPSLPPVYAI